MQQHANNIAFDGAFYSLEL